MMAELKSARPVEAGDLTLGRASFDGSGANLAVSSAHAERAKLRLFDPGSTKEVERLVLPEYAKETWHGYLPWIGRSSASCDCLLTT
jgi:pullulanase/glycogen debranching enzyme